MHVPKQVLPARRAWKPGLPADKHFTDPFLAPECIVQVPLDQLKRWRVQDMPVLASPEIMGKGLPLANLQVVEDFQITMALHEATLWERPKWPAPSKRHNSSWSDWAPSAKRARSPSCTHSILEPRAIGNWKQNASLSQDHDGIWFHFHGSRQPPQLRKPICNGATRMALTFPFFCPSMALRRTSSCSMSIPATWPKPRKRPKRADSICHCTKACSTFLQSKCQESKSAV